ncbi:UNVERIFIED_CONTAM: hypothetical protein HDU68_003718 [Siphonaria sp. JEL0065]|nr:hypothetical protein HDU68_003718 [Siphonaria sp. JEL0065]
MQELNDSCVTPRDGFTFDNCTEETIERLTVLHQSILDNKSLLRDGSVQLLFVNQGFPVVYSSSTTANSKHQAHESSDYEECKLIADCLWALATIPSSSDSACMNSTIQITTTMMEHLASLFTALQLGNCLHKWGTVAGLLAKRIQKSNNASTTLVAEFTHIVFDMLTTAPFLETTSNHISQQYSSHLPPVLSTNTPEWQESWGVLFQGYLDGFGEGKGSSILAPLILKLGILQNGIEWSLVAALVGQTFYDGFLWTRSEGLFWELVDEMARCFMDVNGLVKGGELKEVAVDFAVVFMTNAVVGGDEDVNSVRVRKQLLERLVDCVGGGEACAKEFVEGVLQRSADL